MHQPEAGLLVDAMRGGENALRPEGDLAVAGFAGEADTRRHQRVAEAYPTCRRLDQQKPQLRNALALRVLHQEDMAEALVIVLKAPAFALRDPAALACGIEMVNEIGDDPRGEGFEPLV